ncbi:hypothetical protein POF88_18380 [Enterobacter kobei]|uniref:Acb2/Tad1 domain-containing protein n=1 Tax=Enterobacter kobei TaxID=208224 RepID=UPI0020218D48|nr:hypothetical protein [Enterobacter kobei]EKV5791903.1 hypothetical protein [Enterobacter kobei]ELQ7889109.1 hypothetical protein [Enterobacter kobei]ELT9322751.1 hypothetical protein [Enterobacter kobei]MDH5119057.1 hypothetical protein [Enterobacter kobei]MDX6940128.1 hypothetical protein [Enterobacter kobei]
MSEAKPQDGSTVKGYRTLTPGDIEVMNRLKDVSRHFLNLLETSKETGADPRWAVMAKTEMQKACMFACRAVAKPDDDC